MESVAVRGIPKARVLRNLAEPIDSGALSMATTDSA